jgi:hypothetical protein
LQQWVLAVVNKFEALPPTHKASVTTQLASQKTGTRSFVKGLNKHEFSGAAEYLLLIALPHGLFFMRLFLAGTT